VAAAELDALEFGVALVELVIADRGASRPMSLRNSMVGSSWNSAEASGEAPMLSPALSRIEFFDCDSRVLTCVARQAAPPASTGSATPPITTRPLDPVGGCRFPWS